MSAYKALEAGDFRKRVAERPRDVSEADHQRALDVARRLDILLADIRQKHGRPA